MNNKEIILKIIVDSILWDRTVIYIEHLFNLGNKVEIEFEQKNIYNGCESALDLLTINTNDLREELSEIYRDEALDPNSDRKEPKELATIIYETWLEKIKDFYLKVA